MTDGDTIRVELDSGPISVRLHGIDAPESNQPWGKEATEALRRRVLHQEVALDVETQDRYARLVATVYLGDDNINGWMIGNGHAWVYRQYARDPDYCRWEDEARQARRGLWRGNLRETYAPWEWRRRQTHSVTDYSRETAASCIASLGKRPSQATRSTTPSRTGPAAPSTGPSCLIKGNISSSGRIYHVPGSRSYEQTRIDESKGERWFCSEEEARAAGWRAPR